MKFGNFLFPTVDEPSQDRQFIQETIREAQLCDALGMDAVWLAEHHFDGMCAYVDPVSFAAAIASCTERVDIGFAVAQMALHHPVRFAEQVSMIDNLSDGRIIVGLGRGPTSNTYEYDGYDIDIEDAQSRLEEAEAIMVQAWTQENLQHEGKHWRISIPLLRPRPFTQPHPRMIRASSSEGSMLQLARSGKPFLMNIQPLEVTRQRMELYRATMSEAGYPDQQIHRNCEQVWVWRNVFVAETDQEAAEIGIPAFEKQAKLRARMRTRMYEEQGEVIRGVTPGTVAGLPRAQVQHALIHGSPQTVREHIADIESTGAGGVIASFRIGPMPLECAEHSLKLFMQKVAPQFQQSRLLQ